MKKLVSMYQKYMFRPILYKSVTRVSVVAVLMLLWDRYVSDGTFTMWQAPAEEMNFTTLLEMINASEAREDDPEFQS